MRGERRTAHRNVAGRSCLELSYNLRVEVPLEPRLGRRDRLQRPRVHDLVSRLPDRYELQRGRWEMGNDFWRIPDGHRLVHLAPKEIGADLPLAIVDEGEDFRIQFRPIEVAVFIG